MFLEWYRFISGEEFSGEEFIENASVALALGDKFFHGAGPGTSLRGDRGPEGARIFACHVSNPTAHGVVEFDDGMTALSIEEKLAKPKATTPCLPSTSQTTPSSKSPSPLSRVGGHEKVPTRGHA